jgi:RNA polymerase sigma-70 factor (ECF subfamily)
LNDLSDMAVIVNIQARDRRALEAMYLGYHSHLTQFLSRLISSRNIVDDIINDTFVAVWKCAKEFDREPSIDTWVFRIAYETALRSMRRRSTPSGAPHAIGSDNRLRQALARLSVAHCATLTLAYQMGFSIEAVAEITQSSLAIVNARMRRASNELHGSLEHCTSRIGTGPM